MNPNTTHVYYTQTGDDAVRSVEFFTDVVALGPEHVKNLISNMTYIPASEITLVERPRGKDAPLVRVMACSSCGSTAPHHLQYVSEHGLCVL